MAIAIAVAVYTLLPFMLVLVNVLKNASGIAADPVGLTGASIGQLMTKWSSAIYNGLYRLHDNPLPGGHAAHDLHFP